MTLAGRTDTEIMNRIKAALRAKDIPSLESGAMSYMMSKSSYLSADGDHDMAHVMFFIPQKDGAAWGANAPGSPIFGGSYWFFTPRRGAEAVAPPVVGPPCRGQHLVRRHSGPNASDVVAVLAGTPPDTWIGGH